MEYALRMCAITKHFPRVIANDKVDLTLRKGEILALVGENGAGKSTLMNILYGLHTPDSGEIYIHGKKMNYQTTLGAIEQGVGMVHQHFMLIPRLSIVENVVLGNEPGSALRFHRARAKKEVSPFLEQFKLEVSLDTPVQDLSMGMQQKVEIIKVLYRKANILILDEPTAVLTPQEIDELGVILASLKKQGMSIIIITHKLQEVIDFSDRITVMRRGVHIGTVETAGTDVNEIVGMMVGRNVNLGQYDIKGVPDKDVLLSVKDLSYRAGERFILKDINLEVHKGEILGIAGIDGSGQDELTEIINGTIKPTQGEILFADNNVTHRNPLQRRRSGMGFIPQDRLKHGLVSDFSIEENLTLGFERKREYNRKGFINKKNRKALAKAAIARFDIRTTGEEVLAGTLSGGNQQKVIVAREMGARPRIIVANQPTRGVDIGAIAFIHQTLIGLRNEGGGVLLASLELDELMSLSDRIAVMYKGRLMGTLAGRDATREKLGYMMVGRMNDNVHNGENLQTEKGARHEKE
ncbi:MAG: ABC transporter ATP-binding protein [Clostridiales bacterium]|nr:ABC transporter ATP-binding protein [Clostridiales bacterium]